MEIATVLYFLWNSVKLRFCSLGTICKENMRVSRGAQEVYETRRSESPGITA